MSAHPQLLGPRLPIPPDAAGARILVDRRPVRLTNLRKPYFPDGLTKRDLLDYNYDVAAFLLPYLRDRPYTLKRYPDGVGRPWFFQKEAGAHVPGWIRTVPVPSRGKRDRVNFILCNDPATLLYLVNSGCIDHNAWMSRWQTPHAPDFVLLDLDPGPRAGFDRVVAVALAVRRVLERFEIAASLKTSGATGIHLWIPLAPGHTFEQSRRLAQLVLRLAAQSVPELATEVLPLDRRPVNRVYLDFRQNARGKTISPPYSPRPRPGAPVSTPLRWSELRPGLDPAAFNLRTVRRRLEKYGDLFASSAAQSIADILARIENGEAAA